MRRAKINKCQFPNCERHIKPNATMCSYHWRIIYRIKTQKRNAGKTDKELMRLAMEKEKEYKKTKISRIEGAKHVHAGTNA